MRLVIAVVAVVAFVGCGASGDRAETEAVVGRFYDAVSRQDGEAACAELAEATVEALESQSGQSCRSVVTRLDLGWRVGRRRAGRRDERARRAPRRRQRVPGSRAGRLAHHRRRVPAAGRAADGAPHGVRGGGLVRTLFAFTIVLVFALLAYAFVIGALAR